MPQQVSLVATVLNEADSIQALLDVSNVIQQQPVFVSDKGQILGTFDTGMFPLPARFSINLPVIIPHTAAGIALLLVFGRQGVLGQWLTPLGLTFTANIGGIVVGRLFGSLLHQP